MTSTDEIREQQWGYWYAQTERLSEAMRDLNGAFSGGREPFTYIPPAADDWTEWQGFALWAAIQLRYKWAIARYVALGAGKGPFYCKDHEGRITGGRAQLCLGCSWDNYLEDEAKALARLMRRLSKQEVAA